MGIIKTAVFKVLYLKIKLTDPFLFNYFAGQTKMEHYLIPDD